ncbi:MAG TPA: glycosyltransferase 87 family protein [Chloroflexota bacterium]
MQIERTEYSDTSEPESIGHPPSSSDSAASRGVAVVPRRRYYAVLAPLIVLLILWVWLFDGEGAFKSGPSGKSLGSDWAMFVGAAQVMKVGGDPYNPGVLYRTEAAMMHHQHLSMIKNSQRAQVRVGNPPLLYWAMRPLTDRSFNPSTVIALIALYVLSAVGFIACLRYFGWRARVVPTFIFLLMPQVVLGAYYGNVVGIVFAAVGLSLLLTRRYPLLAGALLSFAWLKPPVALPVVLLVGLFYVSSKLRFALGFSAATAILFVLTLATTGWHSVELWAHGLLRYSNEMSIQPDVISLSGLYVRWMPSTPRVVLELLTVVAALAVTAYFVQKQRGDREDALSIAPLWIVWMLAAPYGHFFDEIILAVPLLAYLGSNGYRVVYRLPAVALYLAFFSLFFISWTPFRVYLLPLMLLGILACMLRSRDDSRFAIP